MCVFSSPSPSSASEGDRKKKSVLDGSKKRRRKRLIRGEAILLVLALGLSATAVALAGTRGFWWTDMGIMLDIMRREMFGTGVASSAPATSSSSPRRRSRLGGESKNSDGRSPSSEASEGGDHRPPRQPIKVIGAGFARTGTSSLKEAMSMLGLSAYHMRENLARDHTPAWIEYLETRRRGAGGEGDESGDEGEGEGGGEGEKGERRERSDAHAAALTEVVQRMSEGGYNATLDFPACLAYADLAELYPNALVVLTVRRSGGDWARSVLRTVSSVVSAMVWPPWPWTVFGGVRNFVWLHALIWDELGVSSSSDEKTGSGTRTGKAATTTTTTTSSPSAKDGLLIQARPPLRDKLAEAHDRRIEEVRNAIPPHRLLVHEPRDGWDPLCEFLGKGAGGDDEVRERCDRIREEGVPYPHVNEDFGMQLTIFSIKAAALLFYASVILAARWVVGRSWRSSRRGAPRDKGDKEHVK